MPLFDGTDKEYATSHPWLTFSFAFPKLIDQNWMRIGEALSKCDHIAGVPMAPAVAEELHMLYFAKGVHATTSIEGNTMSEEEVIELLDGKLRLPASQEYLATENNNIATACSDVVSLILQNDALTLTPERILNIHKTVMAGLVTEDGLSPGTVRTRSVVVGNVYRGAPARDCEFLLAKLCHWLEELMEDTPLRLKRPMMIIRAMLAHLYIAWIHPFEDGNGRTARMVEFQLLAAAGFPTPACHLLANYYNRTKTKYYEVLARTSREPYPVEAFISYALDGFVEELRTQLGKIRSHQMEIAWTNYVHSTFAQTPAGKTRTRQREVVLSLPTSEFTPIASIPLLTGPLGAMYADRGPRTLSRDVNAIERLGLIVREGTGIRPQVDLMAAFLPIRHV